MTRRAVYGTSLVAFLAAVGLTLASMIIPEWITWDTESLVPSARMQSTPVRPIHYSYGLHSRCSSLTDTCSPFPRYEDCQGEDRTFCSLWRTTGFLMSASVALQLASLVAFGIPILGGKQKREYGWKLVCALVALVVVCQVGAVGIIAGVHERDSRFYEGWVLGRSFVLCMVSWAVLLVVGVGLAASAFLLDEEGGYELIPDRPVQ